MAEPRLITAQELADILKLSVETIWRYTRESRIPYIQLSNGQYRYDPEKVLRHLSMNQMEESTVVVREAKPEYSTDKVYTYEDYLRLPNEEGYHYEILDGMLVKEPAPYVHHQRVSRRLQRLLEDCFTPQDPAGEIFNAPIDMTLSDTNVIQPDLVYIPGENSEIVEEARINGIPYLVVEILSKWTRSKDRVRKRNIYERMGVPHYWIVDPYDETIEAYALQNGLYILRSSGLDVGEFTHPDFPGFLVDLAALWRRPE
ncbi:MAG: helix-turn-helix domain-containing protein [Firmicutes bacterium]|jgi:Uma2 family endonuclease|nr:helix-turn-helix domain-containing protein [Bacillota bacterium]